jgi:hypothetical protein
LNETSASPIARELGDCIAHARAGLALYDAKLHRASASSYGNHDASCCAHYYAAMALRGGAIIFNQQNAHASPSLAVA